MSDFLQVMVIALTAQLAVLPGEKVQFLIAGLSTRYNPLVVVSAAGLAFAGWTALEIWLGGALRGVLPEVVLELVTAGFFLLFAYLLVRSAPEQGELSVDTDGGTVADTGDIELPVVGEVSTPLGGFLAIFAMMAVGEFGDKTQMVTISLALQYGAHPAIWAGEMLAIIPVSIANALVFHRFAHRFDVRKAHLAGAGLFVFFGLDTLLSVVVGVSLWETLVEAVSGAILGAV